MINHMTNRTQQADMSRWVLGSLAAIVAVLTIVGLSGTASAATGVGAENRVRASADPATILVGPPESVSAGQRLGNDPSRVVTVVATGVAANAGDDVVRALGATERRSLDDALRPDKLDHIFDPKHNFDPLVQQFGSREAAMEQVVRSIGGPLPQAGRFEIAQSIGGQTVVIRGAVVDGIPRIGTAFTP